jgi:L-lactate dehydrogenase complex protein LldF
MTRDIHFRTKIRAALSDLELQKALDGNADRRQQAFTDAYASLPEALQVMRARAHRIRAETIANLDAYLEQFSANARRNGMTVHRAASADEAIEIVRQIAKEAGARIVSKSKSMVSEEIHLNQALEGDGMRVVETDLGEYIVQLRGEPPAHIITPAVHVSRAEVGKTFQNKLDIPFSEDIPVLTAAARRVLRQTFLDTDIGVSGVNFGVAETGALCLITNEGNGRMVTTLPDIHIALMGIERLVPTMDDLATMLYLLPRSATGQKLTVYTNLIHGPRREGELDGPRQRHLILLDNGRQAMRASSLAEALYCIRCGACLNVCPVFREIGGHAYVGVHDQNTPYPGPIGSVVSPGIFGSSEFAHLARASSLCGACKDACPVDIDLPRLLLRVRAATDLPASGPDEAAGKRAPSSAPRMLSFGLRLYTWMATSARRFAVMQRLAGAFSRLFAPISPWLRLPAFTGWGYQRDFPRPAARPFRARFERSESSKALAPYENPLQAPGLASSGAAQKPSPAPPDRLARFEAELTAIGGTFTRCSVDELPERLLALLREQDVTRIQAWAQEYFPEGLLDQLASNGIRVEQEPDPSISAGLTGAAGGIAETGTLIIPGGPGRPQTASLLPEIHIAILEAERVYADLPQAINLEEIRSVSSAALVTGPSRTADIEMTLTIGVHGPRQVAVFCIDRDA